jgi:hypothetical protein
MADAPINTVIAVGHSTAEALAGGTTRNSMKARHATLHSRVDSVAMSMGVARETIVEAVERGCPIHSTRGLWLQGRRYRMTSVRHTGHGRR